MPFCIKLLQLKFLDRLWWDTRHPKKGILSIDFVRSYQWLRMNTDICICFKESFLMQKKTEMVQQILAEVFAPLSQRSYSDVHCKTPTQLHHTTTTSGEILGLLLLTHAREQTEMLPCCATPWIRQKSSKFKTTSEGEEEPDKRSVSQKSIFT